MNKECIDCHLLKDISLFYVKKESKDGHHNYCKECHGIRNRLAVKKWQKTDSGKEYMRVYSSKIRQISKWKEYNRNYAREYQKSEKGLMQRRIIDSRKRSNPSYRIHSNMSRAIRAAIGNNKANASWTKLVGYSLRELTNHLEQQFDSNMTWNNYGSYWHIDHVIPRSYFNYYSYKEDAFKKCWSLDNLQPLEAIANIKKSNKYYATKG